MAAEVEQLESLLPGARISFAYSGLRDLEARIVDFTMGNVDVMVATTAPNPTLTLSLIHI